MKFWESNHQSVQEGDMQFIALYKFYYQDLYAYGDRKSTRLNSSHLNESRMPSSA